ncbi:hypothetical protein GA0074696_2688 [Micromonospora purpureochromogenes]|uniref:DUF4396 domain-containing protein n=1 Tax=Micromonospora purpureochromogenes TaxID=47872 RepID=A0A1C4XLS6_9ACTN|nr:hypothetical protein GA0074696_2688 [Micromonospora purpureochromogenes]
MPHRRMCSHVGDGKFGHLAHLVTEFVKIHHHRPCIECPERTETVVQPMWLVMLSWALLLVGLASTAVVIVDQFGLGYRQPVKVMEMVWPATATYLGPAAVLVYWKWGRPQSPRWLDRHGSPPRWSRRGLTTIKACHCATHCTLGVIIATPITYGIGFKMFGSELWSEFVGDFLGAVAIALSIRYRQRPSAPRRTTSLAEPSRCTCSPSEPVPSSVPSVIALGWPAPWCGHPRRAPPAGEGSGKKHGRDSHAPSVSADGSSVRRTGDISIPGVS